jgi:type I site-specific restriction endonuclease
VPLLFATNGRPFLRQLAEKSGIWFLDARRDTNHARPLEAWYTPEGLERIGKQLEKEVVVDREALDSGQFKEMGGFTRLNKVFKGELDRILHDIADAMWISA